MMYVLSSFPIAGELVHDLRDRVVDGEQRLEPLLVVLPDRVDPRGADQRAVPDRGRLVGDVGFVERRRHRQRLVRRSGSCRGARAKASRARSGRRHRAGRPSAERGTRRHMKNGRGSAAWREIRSTARPRLDVGLVVGRGIAELDEVPVLVDLVVQVAVGRRIGRAVPLAPARRDLTRVPGAVLVQVLAEMDRLVAGALRARRAACSSSRACSSRRSAPCCPRRRGCARTGR